MLNRKPEVPTVTWGSERSKDTKRDLVLGDTCTVVTVEAIRIGGFSRV